MHPHRRRKKRPTYGVRTVEINRGLNGFGFTISGQAPCILSCIISGSPAEKAGLRPGDYLIAVNGQNVSKALHDDVVELIGKSSVLKLQIAENYYSDSSEDENIATFKLRPKCSSKLKQRQLHSSISRAEKVVQDLQTGAIFSDETFIVSLSPKDKKNDDICSGEIYFEKSNDQVNLSTQQQEITDDKNVSLLKCVFQKDQANSFLNSPDIKVTKHFIDKSHDTEDIASDILHSLFTEQDLNNILCSSFPVENKHQEENFIEKAVLKAVVGYLGTVEMPKETQVTISRLQTIRNCIRRLQIEKKVHTHVLMTFYPQSIELTNMQGLILAEFSADKITFCGVYGDSKNFFGLVTTHKFDKEEFNDNCRDAAFISNSCHIFMIDPKLAPHHEHSGKAKTFNFTCSMDPGGNKCKEFPESAEIILKGVTDLYVNKCYSEAPCSAVALEQTHNNNSCNSSNSDSGVGFKDEGLSEEKMFDGKDQHNSAVLNQLILSSKNFCVPRDLSFSSSHSFIVPATTESLEQVLQIDSRFNINRLTVRAMPDPVGYQKKTDDSENLPYSIESNYLNFIHIKKNSCQISNLLGSSKREQTCLEKLCSQDLVNMHYENCNKKLSPKVYDWEDPYDLFKIPVAPTFVDPSNLKFFTCSNSESLKVGHEETITIFDEKYTGQSSRKTLEPENTRHSATEYRKKLSKTSSLRRYVNRKKNFSTSSYDAGTVSDGELSHPRFSACGLSNSDHSSDVSLNNSCNTDVQALRRRVCHWASGFNVLLEDPAGLKSFSDFLKVEFSQENIIFWIACENYRHLSNQEEMVTAARKIYNRHLCIGASEPVNVDSYARHIAEEGLDFPTANIFIPAQKQIFNLMKFDCYQRFLKSSIFKECMMCEMKGLPLPCEDFYNVKEQQDAEQKLLSDERKKKSLFPWSKFAWAKCGQVRMKSRQAEMNVIETQKSEKKLLKSQESCYDRSIESDCDIKTEISKMTVCKASTCNDHSNNDRRSTEPNVDTVKVNAILFGLELPDKKTICVKAKSSKTCEEILGPILRKFGYRIDQVTLQMSSSLKPVNLDCSVSTIGNKYILVQVKDKNIKMSDLETLTNHIFEDLMKTQPILSDDSSKLTFKSFEVFTLQNQPNVSDYHLTVHETRKAQLSL